MGFRDELEARLLDIRAEEEAIDRQIEYLQQEKEPITRTREALQQMLNMLPDAALAAVLAAARSTTP